MHFSNVLLQYPTRKHAGVTDIDELDAYDSELSRDLMLLHDEILNNPMREINPRTGDEREIERYFNFTLRNARNRLAPAIAEAAKQSKRRKDIEELLEDAEAKFEMAEHYKKMGQTQKMVEALEGGGLSYLHDAIDIIRQTTRNVPAVKTYRPMQPAWGR